MSRFYSMQLEVFEHDVAKIDIIQTAAAENWPFEDWTFYAASDDAEGFRSAAEGWLTGGESEEGFVDRLAVAIWRANGQYCRVEVDATYLENMPFESHCRDEDDYERLATAVQLKQQEQQDAQDDA